MCGVGGGVGGGGGGGVVECVWGLEGLGGGDVRGVGWVCEVCVSPRPIQLLEDARGQLLPLGPRAALHGGLDMKIVSRCAVVAFKWFLQAAPLWRPVCQMTAVMGRGTYRPHPCEASAARLPPGRCLAEGHCGLCRNIRIIGYFMGTVC